MLPAHCGLALCPVYFLRLTVGSLMFPVSHHLARVLFDLIPRGSLMANSRPRVGVAETNVVPEIGDMKTVLVHGRARLTTTGRVGIRLNTL